MATFHDVLDHLAHGQGAGGLAARLLEAWVPAPALRLLSGVAYGRHPRQRLDLYLPQQPSARRRLVVFIYGGCWTAGARGTYRFLAHVLAARGFTVAIPDYRLFPDARFPDFLVDVASAIGWLHRHASAYGMDGGRMALIGHSAGAYNAAMVALDPTYLERAGVSSGVVGGVVGVAGPYAFNPLEYQETREIFTPSKRDPDQAQPMRRIRAHAPPMLLAHGTADRRVLPINSVRFADAMRAAGNDAKVRLYPHHGHVGLLLAMANPFCHMFGVLDDVVSFLDRALGSAR
ncbi:MAG TPA: alpha/beta hydrolase [Geminicoccaceae bacterium]|nr:alpha/beta hydrolase [Geminicoccaceae bacterium]